MGKHGAGLARHHMCSPPGPSVEVPNLAPQPRPEAYAEMMTPTRLARLACNRSRRVKQQPKFCKHLDTKHLDDLDSCSYFVQDIRAAQNAGYRCCLRKQLRPLTLLLLSRRRSPLGPGS